MAERVLKQLSDDYVRSIVERHFDPELGARYWLERDRRLQSNALERVHSFEDLKRWVAFRDAAEQSLFERDSRFRPVEDFVPLSVLRQSQFIWASQTGGTTGAPKHGTWGAEYWQDVLRFSDEMLDLHGVPRQKNWLFIGPTGPHTTGRWIINVAERRGGRCFSIDLDPRIVKIFGEEGMAAAYDRYIRHIWEQVEPIIRHQKIGVLFATSRLLEMLPERLDPALFSGVEAVVHAGTTITRDTHALIRTELFPSIPVVGVYGTSTTSVSYQKPYEPEDDHRVIYIPSSPYVALEIVDGSGKLVDYGKEGHVATYRLTPDSLIPGFWERDLATRVQPFGKNASRFAWDWVEGPFSPEFTVAGKVEGVY